MNTYVPVRQARVLVQVLNRRIGVARRSWKVVRCGFKVSRDLKGEVDSWFCSSEVSLEFRCCCGDGF